MLFVTQRHRLHKRVQTQTRDHTKRHLSMKRMRVTVFDAHRDHIQRHLDKKSCQHESTDQQRLMRTAFVMSASMVVKLREQMQKSQAQQIGARERVQKLDVARVV